MVLRDEHHRHNNNCFAPFFDQCVSDFISPTIARLSCSVPRFHASPTDSRWCQTHWTNDHDSPASLRMEERPSDVVSGNQTFVLSLRICFRCSLTHDDSGRLGGVACVTSSRTYVFTCVATNLLLTASRSSCSWTGSATSSSFSMFASSLNRPSHTPSVC